jgi:hypothetical protein
MIKEIFESKETVDKQEKIPKPLKASAYNNTL